MIERLSPNGACIASGTEEGGVSVRSTAARTACWSVPDAHRGPVCALAWSPDGAAVASGGVDALVKIWEAATGIVVALYAEHAGPIVALAWSPDSCWMTSVDGTGGPHIWPLHHDNSPGPEKCISRL